MADDVSLPASSGLVAADERTINSQTVKIQRVGEIGSSAIATAHVTVTNSAANIVAARETRKRVVITNFETVDIYAGPATVTTSNGHRIPANGGTFTYYTTAAIQGITAAAYTAVGEDDKVHYTEEYDS